MIKKLKVACAWATLITIVVAFVGLFEWCFMNYPAATLVFVGVVAFFGIFTAEVMADSPNSDSCDPGTP